MFRKFLTAPEEKSIIEINDKLIINNRWNGVCQEFMKEMAIKPAYYGQMEDNCR